MFGKVSLNLYVFNKYKRNNKPIEARLSKIKIPQLIKVIIKLNFKRLKFGTKFKILLTPQIKSKIYD